MNDNQQQPVAQAYEVNGELMSQEQYEALRADQLNTLHQIFSRQRDDWVQARAQSGVENRWRMRKAIWNCRMSSTLSSRKSLKFRSPATRRAERLPPVPPSLTIWQAASSPSSQMFVLVGLVFLLPVILGYTWWSYRVFAGKVAADSGYH